MNPLASASLFATIPFVAFAGQDLPEQPQPVVIIQQSEMPQFFVYENTPGADDTTQVSKSAVALYHSIRSSFALSQTEMAKWLGVKRRTLYNWLNDPERATKYGPIIETRLSSLSAMRDEMEPEHQGLIFKIAFSPIYGDPEFGKAILSGSEGEQLINEYDKLFSKFEAYRQIIKNQNQLG